MYFFKKRSSFDYQKLCTWLNFNERKILNQLLTLDLQQKTYQEINDNKLVLYNKWNKRQEKRNKPQMNHQNKMKSWHTSSVIKLQNGRNDNYPMIQLIKFILVIQMNIVNIWKSSWLMIQCVIRQISDGTTMNASLQILWLTPDKLPRGPQIFSINKNLDKRYILMSSDFHRLSFLSDIQFVDLVEV